MDTLTCWQQNGNLSESHCWQTAGNKHGRKFCIVSDSGRKSREERGFVRGVAVWQWGSIGLTSRGLGLWGRKRHRQEVRVGQNSLEMLYHHYQQATDSHQGRKKLRGLRVCAYVCISTPPCRDRSMWMHVCVTNITFSSRVFHLHADCFDSTRHLWKTSGKLLLLFQFCTPLLHQILPQDKSESKLSGVMRGEELWKWLTQHAGFTEDNDITQLMAKECRWVNMHHYWCSRGLIVAPKQSRVWKQMNPPMSHLCILYIHTDFFKY